jgi:hypothetical protein
MSDATPHPTGDSAPATDELTVAAPSEAAPQGTARTQVVVTLGVGLATFVAGSMLHAFIATGEVIGVATIAGYLLSPAILAWLVALLVLATLVRRMAATAIAWFAIGAAALIGLVGGALVTGGAFALGPVPILPIWYASGLTGAAIVGALAGIAYRRRDPRRRTGWFAAALVCLAAGATLALALPMLSFSVYFSLDGPQMPTVDEIHRYEFAALGSLVLLAVAAVLALIGRRRGMATLAGAALVLALGAALAFQVPQGRFTPHEQAPALENTHVCFGTSGDCPGG